MKTFENLILKVEHENIHGEKMTLILNDDMTLWLHHSDINDDFENMRKIFTRTKIKYIFNDEECLVISGFTELSTKLIRTRPLRINTTV